STSKTPSYTKSVSWQHHPQPDIIKILINDIAAIFFISPSPIKYQRHSLVFKYNNGMIIIIE
ncbi:hypothetical protein, partial [Escherichia coli]|uniref:hypothetical protein n=1 Tax=Escherichia coli TaxID=562 RepID=UPI001CDAF0A8